MVKRNGQVVELWKVHWMLGGELTVAENDFSLVSESMEKRNWEHNTASALACFMTCKLHRVQT